MSCTTHHHACDCREAEFQRLQSRVKELERVLELKNITIKALQHNCDVASKSWNELDSMFKLQQERNEKLREALYFYANPESWMIKGKESWRTSSPRAHGDDEMILNYRHPNRDWTGTVVVGGKCARKALLDDAAGGG